MAKKSHSDPAAEVASYLAGEGRDASPAVHRAVLDARWPDLTTVELLRALEILGELREADASFEDAVAAGLGST